MVDSPSRRNVTQAGQTSWIVAKQSVREEAQALGNQAATPPVLARFADLLRDPLDDVRQTAASSVARLGRRAATSKILEALPPLLAASSEVRLAATRAVSAIGIKAATEPILVALPVLLQDSTEAVREAAAAAVEALGPAAATGPTWRRSQGAYITGARRCAWRPLKPLEHSGRRPRPSRSWRPSPSS